MPIDRIGHLNNRSLILWQWKNDFVEKYTYSLSFVSANMEIKHVEFGLFNSRLSIVEYLLFLYAH